MEPSIFTQVLLPVATALIMFGMGLSLTIGDFTRLTKTPKAVGFGLVGQMILMPLTAFIICLLFMLEASLAIGLMILAACPGGTVSNICSQLARANLALSVSLTALSTIICVFTSPYIIQFAVNFFAGQQAVSFSLVKTTIGLCAVTLIPVMIGISIRHRFSQWAINSEVYFRRFSLIFMIAIIAGLAIKERELLMNSIDSVFFACLSLSLTSMAIGVILAKLGRLPIADTLTLGIEVGIQNATLAIVIAITFLNAPQYTIAVGVYGLTMYMGPLLLILYIKLKGQHKPIVIKQSVNN